MDNHERPRIQFQTFEGGKETRNDVLTPYTLQFGVMIAKRSGEGCMVGTPQVDLVDETFFEIKPFMTFQGLVDLYQHLGHGDPFTKAEPTLNIGNVIANVVDEMVKSGFRLN